MNENTADGRVAIGFSEPYVAETTVTNGSLVFSNPMKFARGVEVSIEPDENAEDQVFSADDMAAENIGGVFTGGTLNLTADECLITAKRFAFGIPAADQDGWIPYGDNQNIPYRAFGYITQYISGGVKSWVPTIVPKIRFNQLTKKAKTMPHDGNIEFGTQDYKAKIFRAADTNKTWIIEPEDSYSTKEAALAALITKLGGTVQNG